MNEFEFERKPLSSLPPPAPRGSNGLGLTGFILSLVGVVTCGCFAPLGMIFSLIGVFRRPRGFAVAGIVLSAVGLLEAGAIGLMMVLGGLSVWPAMRDGFTIAPKIEAYRQSHGGALPTAWSDIPGMPASGPPDHWGNPYHYSILPGERVELLSDGPDRTAGTADDIHIQIDRGRVFAYVGKPPPWMR